ncbi:type II toxin-antitoxin system VapC family toxin [SCandidatus Aminicenantes bacterium Aminicenantia_JdfR_composite]|nr:type II toxin-antitoxin system VapC family toxin [SCandidatus Aminicenantes bacterium Aminicenantia_JdfR_composite]MCP2598724.1 type II toxin-antitoxin system VapC family toxin [Candidatus Aminicenantes bacterium AC-335-L06]
MKNTYVLDSSVIIKWFSARDEEDIEKALIFRKLHLQKRCKIIIPALSFYEIGNALRYNPFFDEKDVKDAIESLLKMELKFVPPDKEVGKLAVNIAYQKGITFYDAYFLSLAKISNCLLVTADYKCYERVKDFDFVVRLKDLVLEQNSY